MPEHGDGRNTDPFHWILATGTSWTLTTWVAETLQWQTMKDNGDALIFGVEDLQSSRERWKPGRRKLIGYTGARHTISTHIHTHLIKQSRQHCPATRTPQHTRFSRVKLCVSVCVCAREQLFL